MLNAKVASTIRNIEDIGKRQYQTYVKDVITERTISIHKPIKRNSMPLFKKGKSKHKSKERQKIDVLKGNASLFGQLYIGMQNRNGDLTDFFSHETQPYPPSLSDSGKLHLPSKRSDLLKFLEPKDKVKVPIRRMTARYLMVW